MNQKKSTLPIKISHADGQSADSGENFFKNLLNTIQPGGGVKTDVSITLAPSTFIYMGLAVFLAILAIIVVNKILGELLFNSK